jgi:hypothetical protein
MDPLLIKLAIGGLAVLGAIGEEVKEILAGAQ